MINRTGTAQWNGSGKEGTGAVSSQSGVLSQTQYSFNSRFAEGIGTNPEELIAAAHAGCFSMKLAFVIGAAGFTPTNINTVCTISLDPAKGEVVKSHLAVHAAVEGISAEAFAAAVADAEKNCPISKLLKAEITSEATLN